MQLSSLNHPAVTSADIEACRMAIRAGSHSFYAASALLPQEIRTAARGLYAFCRLSDDAIDLDFGKASALERLRDRLDRIYQGRPLSIPADRALADIVYRYAIPRALPDALLEGFEWDAEARRYEDLGDLFAYATRVAGSVGAIMTLIMGVRAPDIVARACDLGIAMQLTNIARDVGEDARRGRVYLPLQWLREAKIDPDGFLAAPQLNDGLRGVIGRLLSAADDLYERSERGIAGLPIGCRPAIYAARYVYAEIGRQVERNGHDSLSSRARVSSKRKAWLILGSGAAALTGNVGVALPCVDEAQYLIDAVKASHQPAWTASDPYQLRWWNIVGQVNWFVELVDKLERREQY
jgi:phytoene synthase